MGKNYGHSLIHEIHENFQLQKFHGIMIHSLIPGPFPVFQCYSGNGPGMRLIHTEEIREVSYYSSNNHRLKLHSSIHIIRIRIIMKVSEEPHQKNTTVLVDSLLLWQYLRWLWLLFAEQLG